VFVVVQNLPFASGALQVTLFDKRVDKISAVVPEMLCVEVREALEKKLGKSTSHTATPMQNGFGAQWTTDEWTWQAADGTLVQYWQHLEPLGCSLQAPSAANRQRNKPAPVVQP
jgi:hypothetical protein